MAIQLKKSSSYNIGVVVSNAITAVRTVRSQESSRQESEFQRAVAEGLSYEGQIAFREKQISDAEGNTFFDAGHIQNLKDSLASTKKLMRYSKYRTKYQEALGDMNGGRINAEEYAKTLKSLLAGTTDPDLREEILGNIATAETQVTSYKNTLLSNQIKRAEFDGTEKVLKNVMKKVKEARASASMNGNDDEVEAYDLTLASLNSQIVQTRAEDVVNDIAVKGMMSSFNAKSKLTTLNGEIGKADTDTPVTIDGKKYSSEQEYWTITRNAYLTGNGGGVFADFFSEYESQFKTKIDADVARFGFATPATIQSIRAEFGSLRANPDMAPFVERFNALESVVVSTAVDTVAKKVVDNATYTGDFTKADATLKTLGASYGVDTSTFELQLANNLNSQVNAAIESGQAVPDEVSGLLPATDFPIPDATTTPPTPPAAPQPVTPTTPSPTPKKNVDENYYMRPGETVTVYNKRITDYNTKKNKTAPVTVTPSSTPTVPVPTKTEKPVTPTTPTPKKIDTNYQMKPGETPEAYKKRVELYNKNN